MKYTLYSKFLLIFLISSIWFIQPSLGENYYYSLKGITKKSIEVPDLCQFTSAYPMSVRCSIEKGSFLQNSAYNTTTNSTNWKSLRVVEYNIDRNGKGGDGPNENGLNSIVQVLKQFHPIDILLLSEVARDCPQWGTVNGAEYIARELQMEWAYTVEFVEIEEWLMKNNYQCTIGNAVLSSRPLSHIHHKTFKSQCCMFSGRVGGRVAIKATLADFGVTFISSHLESGTGASDFIEATAIRERQSQELVDMITKPELRNNIIIIGGDFNSPLRQFSLGNEFRCYEDILMKKYSWPKRNTCVGDVLGSVGLNSFDYVYFRNHERFEVEPEICKIIQCHGYSDHYPIKIDLKRKE